MKILNTFVAFAAIMIPQLGGGYAKAGLASASVWEVAGQLLEKEGREVAKESAESTARKLGTVAEQYGPSGVDAARKGGPQAFRYLAERGEEGPQIVKLFEKYGDRAIYVVARPKSMAIFLKHGEDAAAAMIRHPGIAEDLITPFGTSAARALVTLRPQNARRLAMMAADGALTANARSSELLDVIARFGDRGLEFIWKNKGALAVGTTLASFLAKPDAFINGAVDLTKSVTVPIVQKAGDATIAMARNHSGNTLVVVLGSIALTAFSRWIQKVRLTH